MLLFNPPLWRTSEAEIETPMCGRLKYLEIRISPLGSKMSLEVWTDASEGMI